MGTLSGGKFRDTLGLSSKLQPWLGLYITAFYPNCTMVFAKLSKSSCCSREPGPGPWGPEAKAL